MSIMSLPAMPLTLSRGSATNMAAIKKREVNNTYVPHSSRSVGTSLFIQSECFVQPFTDEGGCIVTETSDQINQKDLKISVRKWRMPATRCARMKCSTRTTCQQSGMPERPKHLNYCKTWASAYQRIMTDIPSHSGLYIVAT